MDVLANKYRPRKLENVIGQPTVVQAFTNAFKFKTLHQAYILAGAFGSGKTSVARIVAAMENCEKGITLEPCGKCNNCENIFTGKSYDVREINAASNRGIENIRLLHNDLYQTGIDCRTRYIIIDECLGHDTRINTRDGLVPISKIVNLKMDIPVLSYNEKTLKNEYRKITGWFKNSGKQLYKIIFETRGHLYASAGHLLLTPNGYKKIKDLKKGNKVYRRGKVLTNYQKQMIYGSLLGDTSILKNKVLGRIFKNGTSARIKCVHGEKQKSYLLFKENILKDFIKTGIKGNCHIGFKNYLPIKTYKFSTVTDRAFSKIYHDVIVNKKKKINKNWLKKVDWAGIAFWYMDDGSCKKYFVKKNNSHNRLASFHTQCFSLEEQKLLKVFFEEKGVGCNIIKDKKHNAYFLNLTTEGTRILFKNIAKYVPDCMRYKLCDFAGENFNNDLVDNSSQDGVVVERIMEKSIYHKDPYTYDLEIEHNHNYFASNTLVHNCHSLTGTAAEASLKMIEEPPAHVRFILATTDPHKLKSTIHSRCIMWKFRKVHWLELYKHLKMVCDKEKIAYEESALKTIAKCSKGSVRDSLQNLQTVITFAGENDISLESTRQSLSAVEDEKYFQLIDSILDNRGDLVFLIIHDILKDGKEADIVLDGLYNHLNNILLVKKCKNDLSEFSLTDEEIKRYEMQANKFRSPIYMIKMMNFLSKVGFGLTVNMSPQSLLNQFAYESILEIRRKDTTVK